MPLSEVVKLSEGVRLSPEPELQARRRGSRRDLARVTKLMWDIEHGQPVQQDSLDYFHITLCPALAHLAVPRPPGRNRCSQDLAQDGQARPPGQALLGSGDSAAA